LGDPSKKEKKNVGYSREIASEHVESRLVQNRLKIISYFLMLSNRTSTFHTSIDGDGNPDQQIFTVTYYIIAAIHHHT
jgi:hypothetical protein